MAIDTYDNLVESVVAWSHRKDILNLMPDFIKLAEFEIYNNAEAQLRVRELETITTATTDGRYIALPDGFEKARSVQIVTGEGYCDIKYQAPEQLIRQITTGKPRFFTVVGNEIEFDREPDSQYDIQVQYYKKTDPLTEENQTNALITNYPNIYLFSVLHQVYIWSQDIDESVVYAGKMQDAIKGANKADKKARYGPAPSMSVEGYKP